jgi:hypothetical protein
MASRWGASWSGCTTIDLDLGFFSGYAGRSSRSGQYSHISGSYADSSLFFHSGGGQPFHNVHLLTSHNLLKILTARFTASSPKVCLTVLLNALLLPRHSCPFRPRSLMWSGYKITGLIFLPIPYGLGNSAWGGILAGPGFWCPKNIFKMTEKIQKNYLKMCTLHIEDVGSAADILEVHAGFIFRFWRWRQHVPLKHRWQFTSTWHKDPRAETAINNEPPWNSRVSNGNSV